MTQTKTKTKMALAAGVLTLPLMFLGGTAQAATTHNLQTGTHTSNAYDTVAAANTKQMGGYQDREMRYRPSSDAFGR